MAIFSTLIFGMVRWAARKGLRGERDHAPAEHELGDPQPAGSRLPEKSAAARKLEAGRTGMRGETYAYWYLRRNGYVFVARNYMPRGAKGEKQRVVVRTARRFLGERHVGDCPCRFDVLAIDNRRGMAPEVRLHKDAFSPQMSWE